MEEKERKNMGIMHERELQRTASSLSSTFLPQASDYHQEMK